MNARAWKRYFRQVKKQLACTAPEWQALEKQLRQAVQELESEQPGITFAQCVEILGTAEDVAREYEKGLTEQQLAGQKKRRQQRRVWGIAAVVSVIAVLTGLLIYFWYIKEFTVVEVSTTIIDMGDVPLEDIPDLTQQTREGKS